MNTVEELVAAVKSAKKVYVWCNWCIEDGSYFEAKKGDFLASIADAKKV